MDDDTTTRTTSCKIRVGRGRTAEGIRRGQWTRCAKDTTVRRAHEKLLWHWNFSSQLRKLFRNLLPNQLLHLSTRRVNTFMHIERGVSNLYFKGYYTFEDIDQGMSEQCNSIHVDVINLKIDIQKSPTYTIVVIHKAGSIRIKDCTFNKYKDIDIE